jgi:DNA-binding LacI/PurR family transcriptional regulator
VSGPANWFDSRGRIEGWRQTLLAAGADLPPLLPADWSPASGYSAGQMLARMPDVTAIFAANDHLALGIMKAMRERGRRIPQDISLVGFDDIPEAGYFVPPLTTIRPNFDEVARASLDMLLDQIRTGQRSQDVRTIAPALVQRSSVGPPPA